MCQHNKMKESAPEDKVERKNALSQSAAFAIGHVNFKGEYDFSEEVIQISLNFDQSDFEDF